MSLLLKTGTALTAAVFFGEFAKRLKLPKVIGYIAGGMVLGPFGLNFLDPDFLVQAKAFKAFGLAFILFLVGTKIRLDLIKGMGRGIWYAAGFQILFTLLLVGLAFLPITRHVLIALAIAAIAVETAPAATSIVIEEYHAEGSLTEAILLLVTLSTFASLYLFSLIFPFLKGTINPFSAVESATLGFLGAILLGVAGGLLLSYAETKTQDDLYLFLLSLGMFFLTLGLSVRMHLSPYVAAAALGITTVNSSVMGHSSLRKLLELAGPIYALFFFIAGASLHLDLIWPMRYLVLAYFLLRSAGKLLGPWFTERRGLLEELNGRYLGLGTLTHAGLATGLALMLGELPLPEARQASSMVLAGIVLFEILGALILKEVLVRAGEVKAYYLMKKGMEPVIDAEFNTVLFAFAQAFGIRPRSNAYQDLRVKHVMRRSFLKLDPHDPLSTALEVFERTPCNSVPVVDEEGNFHGMAVLKDIEEIFLDEVTKELILAEDLARPVKSLHPETPLEEALNAIREERVDCLPVLDEEGRLVGVVARKDLLTSLR